MRIHSNPFQGPPLFPSRIYTEMQRYRASMSNPVYEINIVLTLENAREN